LLQAVWLIIIPLAAAAAAFQAVSPSALEARSSRLAGWLAALAREQTLALYVALFLGFVAIARYWGRKLPGIKLALAEGPQASRAESIRFAIVVGAALALTLLFRFSVFQPYRVVSSSMLPTLMPGDWIAGSKSAYSVRVPGVYRRFGQQLPRRGDVIAFATPKSLIASEQPDQLVKRVIGLPGDRVEVRGGRPIINGWVVPACDVGVYSYIASSESVVGRLVMEFLDGQKYLTVLFAGSEAFPPYDVKPGEVFVLGDNRNNSSDSRAWNDGRGGGLPLRAIEGRVTSVLLRPRLDGSLDGRSFLKPLLLTPEIEGIDTSEIQAGVARCLKDPPKETAPPSVTPGVSAAL
jgi:signal peptidase I